MSDQFSRALPERPNLEQLKKQAKSLLRDYRDQEEQSVALVGHFERQPHLDRFGLQDAQRILARSYGFPSWARLRERVLVEAIKNGDDKNLAKIIESATDLEKLLTARIADAKPTNHAIGSGATFLQLASYRRRTGDAVTTLLKHGATVDIHSACGLGKVDRISELLTAHPSAYNEQVDTYHPLQFAITAAQVESIECLMQHGDDPNRDLKKVAYFGWEDEMLDQDYAPWKPIHMASLYGFDAQRIPVAECLLKHGADINAASPLDGYRPIHLVAMPNRVDMIRYYVENGADVDSRTAEGKWLELSKENAGPVPGCIDSTPLMIACGEGFLEATQCLLDLGADANAQNDQGLTPLHFAARRHWNGQPYDAVVKLLLARGADKSIKDGEGNVPEVS